MCVRVHGPAGAESAAAGARALWRSRTRRLSRGGGDIKKNINFSLPKVHTLDFLLFTSQSVPYCVHVSLVGRASQTVRE